VTSKQSKRETGHWSLCCAGRRDCLAALRKRRHELGCSRSRRRAKQPPPFLPHDGLHFDSEAVVI